MSGPWHQAWQAAKDHSGFLDLTDSRFHQNGLLPDKAVFETAFGRWLDQRSYEPDSRGQRESRAALADFYQSQGWRLPLDQFFLTAGTSEAYSLLFSTFANAGDNVALPCPGYPLFEQLARHCRLETVYYEQPADEGWQPNAKSLEAVLTPRTKFVVVISPNNPTGQVAGLESLAALADVCRARNLSMIVDEVFDACLEVERPLPRPGALFPDLRSFTLNGISKRFGSPDLKLAWIAVSGPTAWTQEVCSQLDLANDTFLSANSFSQFLLPELFRSMAGWQQKVRHVLSANRRATATLMELQPRITGSLPQGGIHGLWRFEGLPRLWDDERWAVHLMKTDRLSLHPGFFYDLAEPGVWLVYSLLKDPALFAEGLGRLSRRLSLVGSDPAFRR